MTTIASLFTYNANAPKSTGWTDVGTLTAITAVAIAPDGSLTAFSTTDADGGAICRSVAPATIPVTNLRYVVGAWVKKTTGTPSNYPAVGITFGDVFSPARYAAVEVDTTNGTILPATGWYAPEVSGIQDWGTYWFVYVGFSNVTGETSVAAALMPAWGAPPFNGGGSSALGGTTTWWYPIIQQGNAPVLPTVSDLTLMLHDRQLTGVTSVVAIDTLTVAATAFKRIAKLSLSTVFGTFAIAASLEVAYQPGQLACVGSNLFAVGDDGRLHKYSTAPAEVTSVAVTATYPWIAVARGFILVHAGNGQIATYNTSLVKQSQRPTSLPDVVYATADSAGNVYAFDGRGFCSLLTVSAAGAITFSQKFAVPNSIGVRSAWVDESLGKLVVGCAQLARVIVVDTTTLAVDSSTTNVGRQLNSLCVGDPSHRAVFEDVNAAMSPSVNLPFNCGACINSTTFVLGSSKASSVLMYVEA